MTTGFKTLLIAGLLASGTLYAQAQTTTAAAPMPMAGASSPHMHGANMGHERGTRGHWDSAKMNAMVAKHMADLKTKLKITATQESAWTAFTDAMKPPARTDAARPDRAAMEKLTTPERIDKMRAQRAQRMTDMQAQMTKREDATKTFYAALDTVQQKTFDAEHSKMMHRWGDRKGKGHGPRHMAPEAPVKS